MIITAGLGSPDDYSAYRAAGADEVFTGYIPRSWQLERGLYSPLNRREVISCGAQAGGENELMRLVEAGAKVAITVNSLSYRPEEYPRVAEMIEGCLEMGIDSFIIADPALIVYLNLTGLIHRVRLHVSGEYGEMNRFSLREAVRLGAKRIIFNRKVTTGEMAFLTPMADIEYEAFLMNEMCRYSGMHCEGLHCDEMPPICREEYMLPGIALKKAPSGVDGCGLCALYRLEKAGITHLKIVGRGARAEDMVRSISAARLALDILTTCACEEEYIGRLAGELPQSICGGGCYYSVPLKIRQI